MLTSRWRVKLRFLFKAFVLLFLTGISLTTALAKQPGKTISNSASAHNKEIFVLDELVVTASRTASDQLSTAAILETRNREALEDNLVRTVPEALRQIPGVAVQKSSNGQGSPIIRGFTGYRTLALIDGIRYNHSAYRDGPNEYFALVDPQALERLELLQGPSSVLYGSDAVGGVLNLFTRDSGFHDEEVGKSYAHGSLFGRWHSSEQSWQGRADYNFGKGNEWGIHLGGTWKDFGEVIAAKIGEQPTTGYSQPSYDLCFDTRLNNYWKFTLAHQSLWQNDSWRTHATVYGIPFAGSEIGTDLRRVTDYHRSLTYARLRGDALPGFIRNTQFTVSYQTLDEDLDRVRSSRASELSNMAIGTLGFDSQFTSDILGGSLTWGLDYYHDDIDTARNDFNADGTFKEKRIQGPVGDDASYDLLGIYAQQELPLGEQGTVLQLGGRYTYAKASVGRYEDPISGNAASLEDDWHNLSGNLRVMQDLDRDGNWKAYGGISQAFRAPNIGDLSRLGASRSDEIESAAFGLKPEQFTNFELGLKHRSEKLRLQTAAYYTVLDDYIASTPTGRVIEGQRQVTKQNSSSGYVQGIIGEIEWDVFDQFTLFGGLSWTEGETDAFIGGKARREPLSRIPPLTTQYGIRWSSPEQKIWLDLSATTVAKADRLNSADREDSQRVPPNGTPGYTLLNVRAGWQADNNITLLAGLDNILNEAYRVHGSGSNEPGFGGMLGAKLTF